MFCERHLFLQLDTNLKLYVYVLASNFLIVDREWMWLHHTNHPVVLEEMIMLINCMKGADCYYVDFTHCRSVVDILFSVHTISKVTCSWIIQAFPDINHNGTDTLLNKVYLGFRTHSLIAVHFDNPIIYRRCILVDCWFHQSLSGVIYFVHYALPSSHWK